MIYTATATREGTAKDNADAAAVYTAADGRVGAAVIDGIGHTLGTSVLAPVLAEVAARVAAQRGPLAGLLSAALLVADAGPHGDTPNAVGVVARTNLDGSTTVTHVGDCRVYGWDGATLHRYGVDHTMREYLLRNGASWNVAEDHSNWVRTSLAHATVATVHETEVTDRLVILTSDGVHDQIDHDQMMDLVRAHEASPEDLADALVEAAKDNGHGYRDDATAVVIACP